MDSYRLRQFFQVGRVTGAGRQKIQVEGRRCFVCKGDEGPNKLRNVSSYPTYYIGGVLPGNE